MEFRFILIRDMAEHGQPARVTPFFGMESAINTARLGQPAIIVRASDRVILFQQGDVTYLLSIMARVMENPESGFFREGGEFRPPCKKQGGQDDRPPAFDPPAKPDIAGWNFVRNYSGVEWAKERARMTRIGVTLHGGDFATAPCACCGSQAIVGMYVKHNGEETRFWVNSCASCGDTNVERAYYEGEASNG